MRQTMTREELKAKYRAEAEVAAGRPLADEELETGMVLNPGENPFRGEPGQGTVKKPSFSAKEASASGPAVGTVASR